MTEIQGKSILVRVIGSRRYIKMNSLDQFYKENSLLLSICLEFILEFSGFGVYKSVKRQFIDIVPIKAYIRNFFFKSRLCSRSSFIACSNFRVNILRKDVLDLYDLVCKVAFNLIIQNECFATSWSARCQERSPLSR